MLRGSCMLAYLPESQMEFEQRNMKLKFGGNSPTYRHLRSRWRYEGMPVGPVA